MKPFEVYKALDELTDVHPSADILLKVAGGIDHNVRYAICRLWLSEGLPFAFKTRPSVYEAVRIWLANSLAIQAKQITIIGSGRQGFSLSPDQNIGRLFGTHSDLDFTIVSLDIFQRLKDTFHRWADEYRTERVHPRNNREKSFWDENMKSCASGFNRGFVDPHKIPTFHRYPEANKVAQTMYLLNEKFKITPGAPVISKVSLRIYKDWDSFILQMAINLEAATKKIQNIRLKQHYA